MSHIPLRMCVACREMKPLSELIRVVANRESGLIELDIHKKKFGRGAYVCRKIDCVKKAEKYSTFEKRLKGGVAGRLYEQMEDILFE